MTMEQTENMPPMTPLEQAREAFVSRLHHVLVLASKHDDRLTRAQIKGCVASLEAYLDELFSTRSREVPP